MHRFKFLIEILNKVLDFVSRPARSHAPVTPRVILIGPYGSGRRTQANAIAKKYDIVNGNCFFKQLFKNFINLT